VAGVLAGAAGRASPGVDLHADLLLPPAPAPVERREELRPLNSVSALKTCAGDTACFTAV
jgi:hypothetical protein